MRFGLFIPQGWRLDLVDVEPERQWDVMAGLARRAEAGPWSSLWVYDHFHTTPEATDQATHEAWSLMSAFAASTQRIRLGQMCTCTAYRNPAYLAKVAATIDVISGGRVEMGIGAGWYEHEWRAYGYGFPSAGERLGMLSEGVQIMRQAWTHGTSSLDGKHYQVDGAICRPLPLQDDGIPIWLAGGGEKVTLRIAARNARGITGDENRSYVQYTNFGGTLEPFIHKSKVLADHCRDVGSDFDSITRSANFNVVLGETPAEVDDQLARIAERNGRHLSATGLRNSLTAIRDSPAVGTVEQVVANLKQMHAAGMTYTICYFPLLASDTRSLDLFEQAVVPALS